MTQEYWEHFEHQADIGVRGTGLSKEKAFEQAAIALVAVIAKPEKIVAKTKVEIECEAGDIELLLADWLNAIIYEMATSGMLFSKFDVKIDGTRLKAKAWGEKINLQKHQPTVEPKAATYNQLSVKNENGIWKAQCVVDV